ncbi:CRISPR-associated helicase Cas3' [Saccharothrix violaceirubra]|uniref:CRISPR-associated endonuclease/helicase Cas3 n=1 Tax=Saccharothrix violaceirubra TaxID=413306 RepID=A0A7W7T4C4_9PSEU|nr:CRISPR-associated helicase Cas3' [Saccharothrix violaceirubra]MBB4966292.1 CRISPR-associated endonuclease/helicase Cas3 [Saccharothrix violaceirubra]
MWGKWTSKGIHPLICHLIDTASVARELSLSGPGCRDALRAAFAPLGDADGWIALLSGIHDIGKCSPGFQGIRGEEAAVRLDEADDVRFVAKVDGVRRVDVPHGLVTAVHVKDMLTSWGAGLAVADEIAVTLGGHHGYFPKSSAVTQARAARNDLGGTTWAALRDDMVLQVADALGLPDPRTLPWSRVGFGVVEGLTLAALTTVADWIASDVSNYESPEEPVDLAAYTKAARERAVKAVAKAGIDRWVPPTDTSFLALHHDHPRPVQAAVERLVADRTGPTLVVVEAPTGEGKTRLAFQAAATLVRDLGPAGVYVAMPTKATSNQVLAEFEKMLKRTGDGTPIRLVHSEAREHLAERPIEPSDVGRDDPDDSDVAAREWFTRKKSLLAALGVGTVDQVLRAAIRTGHGYVRLGGLSGKVVVFDEVHAYDTHMTTLFERLLMWLGRLGVSVVVLSATLPTRRRNALTRAWQAGLTDSRPSAVADVPRCADYPRVTVADAAGVVAEGADTSEINQERDVRLDHPVSDDEIVPWLVKRAGCVASIHNTVGRAKHVYDEVDKAVALLPEAKRPKVKLIHGQLDRAQRRELEAWLKAQYGPGGQRTPAIVVGTQVLEQSLDLDFDAMLTDLAPIDLLIQRAGRVHRHARRGPLVLGITGVTDTDGPPVFPRYTVYSRYILSRTWALVRGRKIIHCPREVPELVDKVYGPADAVPCPPGWEKAWHRYEESDRARAERELDRARDLYLPMPIGEVRLEGLSGHPQDPRKTRRQGRKR